METLSAKKVRLLGRWLWHKNNTSDLDTIAESMGWATSIISLLNEIEQAHWSKEFEESGTRND